MTKIGRYELHEMLGRGGYGTVYRAVDTALEVGRAVKVLHPALAADPDFIERFRREARLAARLRHPNIAPVYDLDEDQGRYFLAMDYLPGGSLKERLEKSGALPFAEALHVVQQAAAALDYAHAQGLVHRDVKPGNILFDADGSTRLIDFGFAKALAGASSASLSAAGGMIGTPAYMAPEVWREQPATPATDVYSLACVTCEMLTGQPLFPGDSPAGLMTRHLMDGPQFPAQWPADAPPGLSAVLEQALAKDPAQRYPRAGAFAEALAGLSAGAQQAQQQAAEQARLQAQAAEQRRAEAAAAAQEQARREAAERERRAAQPPAPTRQSAPRRSGLPGWAWAVGALGLLAILIAALAGIGALVAQNQRQAAALTQAAQTQAALAAPANPTAPIAVATDAPTNPTPVPTARPSNTPAPRATSTPAAPQGMVLIPAGSFQMGSDADDSLAECQKFSSDCQRDWFTDEEPVHTVNLTNDFYTDIYEVTNAQFAAFLNEQGNQSEGGVTWLDAADSDVRIHQSGGSWTADSGYADHPVVQVTWYGAQAYCAWRGARLPTEAEWEYAARGGLEGMNYPWGDEYPVCTPGASNGSQFGYCGGPTDAVGTFEHNDYGLYDMAGNVEEWVSDCYRLYSSGAVTDPPGPPCTDKRVRRGGSWESGPIDLRVAYRSVGAPVDSRRGDGFRCARSP